MPVLEIDKQIDVMMGVGSGDVAAAELEDDWTPPAPFFWCQEHERVADALFGPTAEMLTGKEALSRRIQVISDLEEPILVEANGIVFDLYAVEAV
jgi:hypothetical protein